MRAARAARTQKLGDAVPTALVWSPLGPAPLASDASGVGEYNYGWVSGRATAVAIDPADPTGSTVYIGGAYGGVWKSTNATQAVTQNSSGVTWTALTDNQATLAVGAIAIQPGNNNPNNSVILVGTGETNSSADSYYGLGILRSPDAGTTWTLITVRQHPDAVFRRDGVQQNCLQQQRSQHRGSRRCGRVGRNH